MPQNDPGLCRIKADPKSRETWRNVALIAWLAGIVPGAVAVVVLSGPTAGFVALVSLNGVFLVLNCGFCCVTLQRHLHIRIFYLVILAFVAIDVALLIIELVDTPRDVVKTVGFLGLALVIISCIALVILNILLHVNQAGRVPASAPTSNGARSNSDDDEPEVEETPDGFLSVRYVSLRRGRAQDETIYQVEPGQVLNLPQPDVTVTNYSSSANNSSNSSLSSRFRFRPRQRQDDDDNPERLQPIEMISDGICNSNSRRNSAISLMRRTSNGSFEFITEDMLNPPPSSRRNSTTSAMRRVSVASTTSNIEYDTGSVRCTCFDPPNPNPTPNPTNPGEDEDSEETPPYLEMPTINMTNCPIHGENPLCPPPYDHDAQYDCLHSILGLPTYEDVVPTSDSATDESASMSTLAVRRESQTRRVSNSYIIFETIPEDGSEVNESLDSEPCPPNSGLHRAPSLDSTKSSSSSSSSSSNVPAETPSIRPVSPAPASTVLSSLLETIKDTSIHL